MSDVELIKVKLIEGGFTGLYNEGECACEIDDLVPCCCFEKEDGEEYVNGCEPGFKFEDDKNQGFWVVKSKNIEPSEDEWDRARREWL